uniref:RING-type domain-containing protein n=1 Tax=Denticeps clupeoides TaxID=299321 RepID=A0AAY4BTH2_9TELE
MSEQHEDIPDLECAICFSTFDNVFRTPKMLGCKHTFCLECLARMNVKSSQPNSIQCPLCRSFTPLPNLGLPKLTTDPAVLSCLPDAMQKVYSIRFSRTKGRLLVKNPKDGSPTVSQSIDVGVPQRRDTNPSQRQGFFAALRRLFKEPVCRALLSCTLVVFMTLFTVVIIVMIPR